MGTHAVGADSLLGRKCLIQIIEPYDIAANIGDPPLEGRVVRFEATENGGTMWIRMDQPIEDEQGRVGNLVIVSPRHAGALLADLLVKDNIAAGAGLVPDELLNRPIEAISQTEAHYFAIVTVRLAR
jgi:hypothetical protein